MSDDLEEMYELWIQAHDVYKDKIELMSKKLMKTKEQLYLTQQELKGLATIQYLYFYEENNVTKATYREILNKRIMRNRE